MPSDATSLALVVVIALLLIVVSVLTMLRLVHELRRLLAHRRKEADPVSGNQERPS
ncbi:MAG TPA: hypothetical protein VHD90_12925 [Phototrophicaceae bacterium]|nr:hypothetical protein [Phototrophicaceae bacterium]